MKNVRTNNSTNPAEYSIIRYFPNVPLLRMKGFGIVLFSIAISNLLTHSFFNKGLLKSVFPVSSQRLYLSDKAALYVQDIPGFEEKVKEISLKLEIPPEWLMSVMYSESRFDASAVNFRGSGAVGLIQFMPATATEMGTSTTHLQRLTHIGQLDYVFQYLNNIKSKYGKFDSLTKLYLAILYPKAVSQDACYVLYAKPSIMYKQNSGLDENKDGVVCVSDIDKRMLRVFPAAYIAKNPHIQ
ncbi:MAG: transglycosylase SLT domain-containing protein [Bacteroidia bacterium]|nr:transglycosylase SLT domain-containing protein [Bacteroidia bacterium]